MGRRRTAILVVVLVVSALGVGPAAGDPDPFCIEYCTTQAQLAEEAEYRRAYNYRYNACLISNPNEYLYCDAIAHAYAEAAGNKAHQKAFEKCMDEHDNPPTTYGRRPTAVPDERLVAA